MEIVTHLAEMLWCGGSFPGGLIVVGIDGVIMLFGDSGVAGGVTIVVDEVVGGVGVSAV